MIFPGLRVEFTGGNKIQPVDFGPKIENRGGHWVSITRPRTSYGGKLPRLTPWRITFHDSTARRRTSRKRSFSDAVTSIIGFMFKLLCRILRLVLWLDSGFRQKDEGGVADIRWQNAAHMLSVSLICHPRILTPAGKFGAVNSYHRCQCRGGSWPAGSRRICSAVIMNARPQLRHRHLPKG